MGDCNNGNKNEKKRGRDDSEADSPESKILRVDSASFSPTDDDDANSSESQLTRVNSDECDLGRVDSVLNSSGVNEIQDELLNMLDDTDNVTDRDPPMQGLDSVIKSFEEEILAPGPDPDLVPESGECNPNLGYLLEASDDELGLPPKSEEGKVEVEESGRVGPEGVDLTGFPGFEDDIRSYEAFGFGNGVVYEGYGGENGGSYVTIDGLFDYAETADILWRSESLQAM